MATHWSTDDAIYVSGNGGSVSGVLKFKEYVNGLTNNEKVKLYQQILSTPKRPILLICPKQYSFIHQRAQSLPGDKWTWKDT